MKKDELEPQSTHLPLLPRSTQTVPLPGCGHKTITRPTVRLLSQTGRRPLETQYMVLRCQEDDSTHTQGSQCTGSKIPNLDFPSRRQSHTSGHVLVPQHQTHHQPTSSSLPNPIHSNFPPHHQRGSHRHPQGVRLRKCPWHLRPQLQGLEMGSQSHTRPSCHHCPRINPPRHSPHILETVTHCCHPQEQQEGHGSAQVPPTHPTHRVPRQTR